MWLIIFLYDTLQVAKPVACWNVQHVTRCSSMTMPAAQCLTCCSFTQNHCVQLFSKHLNLFAAQLQWTNELWRIYSHFIDQRFMTPNRINASRPHTWLWVRPATTFICLGYTITWRPTSTATDLERKPTKPPSLRYKVCSVHLLMMCAVWFALAAPHSHQADGDNPNRFMFQRRTHTMLMVTIPSGSCWR